MSTFQKLVTVVASFIPLLLPPLRAAAGWSRQVGDLAGEYQRLEERERERYEALWDEEVTRRLAADEERVHRILSDKNLPDETKVQQLEAMASRGNLVAFDHWLSRLESKAEEQRRKIGPTAEYMSLLEFVQARQDEQSYENQLGLMHQVQKDIEELTNGLTVTREEQALLPDVLGSGNEKEEMDFSKLALRRKTEMFPRGEPRVVLYIDDLDRCPPDRVAEVMEAVQLLLRTKLFIVVLGLDTRYVTLALEKEYSEILRHEGDPSGLDYIEKILQIPYRVPPIREDKVRSFLQKQMDVMKEESRRQEVEAVAGEQSGDGYKPGDGGEQFEPEPSNNEKEAKETTSGVESTPLADLPPEVIRFQPEDLDDLEQCCRQIDLTPRSVKRLINVLKLVEVFWFRTLGHSRERRIKKCMIGFLALSAGYPEIMREAFARLDTKYRDETAMTTTVSKFLKNEFILPDTLQRAFGWQMDRFHNDVTVLANVKGDGQSTEALFPDITLAELERQTFNLVRSFSFVGDPSYAFDNAQEESLVVPSNEV